MQPIKKGDKVDLSTLLFTKQRDYLLRGDKQRVHVYVLFITQTYHVMFFFGLFVSAMLQFVYYSQP